MTISSWFKSFARGSFDFGKRAAHLFQALGFGFAGLQTPAPKFRNEKFGQFLGGFTGI
jgi:hypothetical protein